MPTKLLNGAEFLHIPKTGGTWVEAVFKVNGLIQSQSGHRHADYNINLFQNSLTGNQHLAEAFRLLKQKISSKISDKEKGNPRDTFRFCFVRNPLSWYESWWKYMMEKEWTNWGTADSRNDWHPNTDLNGLGSSDFNEFVYNVIKKRPGYVTELMFSYTKSGVSFIGKTENLRAHLAALLDILGLKYKPETISNSRKVNYADKFKNQIEWDPKIREAIIKLELPSLIHYDYLTEKEKTDLFTGITLEPHRALYSINHDS